MMRALLLALLLCGCKQDAGERCQTNSDCSGSLMCCQTAGQVLEGTCHATCGGGEGEAEGEAEGEEVGPIDAPADVSIDVPVDVPVESATPDAAVGG
jgi:hypothetical protein